MQNILFNLPKESTFNEIIENIDKLKDTTTGISILEPYTEEIIDDKSTSITLKLPYDFRDGIAIIFNNELHILGGEYKPTAHYKWNGVEWTLVETLPFEIEGGSVTIHDQQLYYCKDTLFYTWNGNEWKQLGETRGDHGDIISFNNTLYMFSGRKYDNTEQHYWVYNTRTDYWAVHTDKLPYPMRSAYFLILNNEIYAIGGDATVSSKYKRYFYKASVISNKSSWTALPQLPFNDVMSAVVYNNEIHIFNDTSHYKFNGDSWVKISELPYDTKGYSKCITYNNYIYLLGGWYNTKDSYVWDGTSWNNKIIQTIQQSRYIFKYYLDKNFKIICDKNKLFKDTSSADNIIETDNGYIVDSAGVVILTTVNNPTEIDKLHSILCE